MSDPVAQARQHFEQGLAAFDDGRLAQAETHFEAALALVPGRVSVLVNLAATRTRLGRPDAALPLIDAALAAAPDDADAWWQRGLALSALRRFDEALACQDRVLALLPEHAAAAYQRAATLTALRRHAEAAAALERLLALTPDDAQAWLQHGQALQRLARPTQALASYERALDLAPGLAQAWTNRADILKHAGRADEAADCLRQALRHGGDTAINGYHLAALTGQGAPSAPPRRYVERLFDDYAETFDEHLVGALGYRAHRLLLEPLQGAGQARFRSALDLGCGTGLCGPLIKAVADRVDGVDLSSAMLEKARALGVYERLDQADLVAHLAQTEQRHDLVVAADVFIYVGALEAVFGGVRRVLQPGGAFCFSAEQAAGDVAFELRPSLRYAHSEPYLRALATRSGFEVRRLDHQPLREDQRLPIAGLYFDLRKV